MISKDARIYVAGHRGLVGSAIVRKLKENGYQISCSDHTKSWT